MRPKGAKDLGEDVNQNSHAAGESASILQDRESLLVVRGSLIAFREGRIGNDE
jgi:hypothetical protein